MARWPGNAVIDVLGLGIVTVDDLLYLDHFPAIEEKLRVQSRLRQCGGVTGTALVAAARLGALGFYAGQLSSDPLSDFIRETLSRENIDLSLVDPSHHRLPIHSTILVENRTRTRTILFEKDDAPYQGHQWPEESVIRSCRVLFLDHDFSERGVRAARIARSAGIPIVADFERDEAPDFPALLALADHLIVNDAFARRITGQDQPRQAAETLWNPDRAVVVVTSGALGCWWIDRHSAPEARFEPAFAVETEDSTGCGDVFHGAYAACLARGDDLATRLRIASAAAALKALHRGGQAGAPSRSAVEAFLLSQSQP